jgi:hypothetical protein
MFHFEFFSQTPTDGILSIAGTFAQIGASMLGFMLAAMAILASISDTHLLKVMKAQGYYQDLLQTLFVGCFIYLSMAFIAIVLLFSSATLAMTSKLLAAISISALVSLLDLGHKFWLVLLNLNK